MQDFGQFTVVFGLEASKYTVPQRLRKSVAFVSISRDFDKSAVFDSNTRDFGQFPQIWVETRRVASQST